MLLAPAFAALVVAISPTADVSPSLVGHVVDETNAIWTPVGVTVVPRRPADPPPALEIVIGRERGRTTTAEPPLGWIEFDDGQPQPRLYLSYANAVTLFDASRGIVGPSSRMPMLERETYLGRALGRALAHEIGHYLLAARTHTADGLMKASFSAVEFFLPESRHFTLTGAQRALALARVGQAPLVAASAPGASSASPRAPAPPRATARWSGSSPN